MCLPEDAAHKAEEARALGLLARLGKHSALGPASLGPDSPPPRSVAAPGVGKATPEVGGGARELGGGGEAKMHSVAGSGGAVAGADKEH